MKYLNETFIRQFSTFQSDLCSLYSDLFKTKFIEMHLNHQFFLKFIYSLNHSIYLQEQNV